MNNYAKSPSALPAVACNRFQANGIASQNGAMLGGRFGHPPPCSIIHLLNILIMKKLSCNLIIAFLLVLAGMPANIYAQTQTQTPTWTASAITEVSTGSANKDTETGCIYLYNVGTGEFINFGGDWGTQPMTHEVGMPLYLETGTETFSVTSGDETTTTTETYYKIGSNTDVYNGDYSAVVSYGHIGYIRGSVDQGEAYKSSWGKLFVDRDGLPTNSYDAIVRMTFTNVGSTTNGPIYNISFRRYYNSSGADVNHDSYGNWPTTGDDAINTSSYDTYYLVAQAGDNLVVNAVNATTETAPATDTYAQWMIVTRRNFEDDFARTNTGGQTEEANATFMVYDQNFNRNNSHQRKQEITSTTDQSNCVWKFLTTSETTSSGTTSSGTLYIGSGGTANQETYGQYWLACINGTGTLYQEISLPSITTVVEGEEGEDPTTTTETLYGWYQLRVKAASTVSTSEVFIATIAESASYAGTPVTIASTTVHQLDADKYNFTAYSDNYAMIAEIDEQLISATSEYKTENYVMIYVPEGSKIVIGVKTTSGWTLVDDVQLYYAGQTEAPLILDEDWSITADASINNYTGLDYINAQVSSSTQTLYLNRTLNEGVWNSLVLPVSLTAGQVREAFGDDTQICTLKETGNYGYDIYFESVSGIHNTISALHDATVVINAGSNYIIKPSDLDWDDTKYSYTVSLDEKYKKEGDIQYFYQIPMVTLSSALTSHMVVDDNTVHSDIDNGIRMQGTYLAGVEIPQYSYALSGSNDNTAGKWYYLTTSSTTEGGSGITSQGFRAWIVTEEGNPTSAHPTTANLFIDGVQVTDGIERVMQDLVRQETSGSVYSLSGQMVNASGSLEGLPKGIYVKNGKKYVVK